MNDFLDLDRPAGRPSTRPGSGGGAAGDFLQNRPAAGARPGTRDQVGSNNRINRIDNRSTNVQINNRVNNRPVHVNNRQAYVQNRTHRRNEIRGHYRNHPSRLPYHGGAHWGGNHGRWGWNNHSHNWWRWATAGALTGWVVGGSNQQPTYYNYGDNCYYEGDTVYYEGEAVATADEFAEQARTIATSVPEVEPDDVEWMPLGVYALTQGGEESDPEPTIFLQLAVSKEGIIAGTIQNTATDTTTDVEGTIDTKSQRAAWGVVGKDWPIMETGIYNLTEDDAPALLHFADSKTQQWLMVRLEEPKDDAPENSR